MEVQESEYGIVGETYKRTLMFIITVKNDINNKYTDVTTTNGRLRLEARSLDRLDNKSESSSVGVLGPTLGGRLRQHPLEYRNYYNSLFWTLT